MGGFLDYVPGKSILHKCNPLTKLVLALLLCVSCFVSENHFYIVGIIMCNLLLAALAGVFERTARMLLALVKFSIILFLLQILFVRQGEVLLQLPLNLVITETGLSFSLLFILRFYAATIPLALMLSVTQMSDLSNVLVEKVGIPYKYTFALTTAIRFIPIFTSEMSGIMEAQVARGVEFDTKNFFKKIKLIMPLCVPLLISSVNKIDDGAVSAELRGFNLRGKHSGYKKYGFAGADACMLVLTVGVMAGALLL